MKVTRTFALLGIVTTSLAVAGSALSGPPLPLPAALQGQVNKAIDRGVFFLKFTQGAWGTWAAAKSHLTGYAALPGLTLLECGVPAKDPSIQRAAAYVRVSAPTLKTTYELSLSILFLDRLGDSRDRPLIQKLALRLIAGQTSTGGWSYKCPILPSNDHKELLTLLRKLPAPRIFDPLAPLQQADPEGNMVGLAKDDPRLLNPLGKPDAVRLPEGLDPLAPGRLASPASGTVSTLSPGESAGLIGGKLDVGPPPSLTSAKPNRCIKAIEPPEMDVSDGPPTKPAGPVKTPRIVVPPQLRVLVVVHDPSQLPLVDLPKRDQEPLWGTTDNSNSQFAILALWAARRHEVPMVRTLNLISRRYATSQNLDGGWGYRYRFGGGENPTPSMTCVGLLGMAVAHGLAREQGMPPKAIQDPRIIQGFVALDRHIGNPTGKWQDLPMANLYFLWSLERVGVLYGLPTIAGKDWYRWGAEILVANQKADGNWDKGAYPGASPALDTCLALLFLKRANLAADLTDKLPFKPAELSNAILSKLPPPPKEQPNEPKCAAKPGPLAGTVKLADPLLAAGVAKGSNRDVVAALPPPERSAAPPLPEEESGTPWGWILAVIALLLLIAAAVVLLAGRADDDEDAEAGKSARKRRKTKKLLPSKG